MISRRVERIAWIVAAVIMTVGVAEWIRAQQPHRPERAMGLLLETLPIVSSPARDAVDSAATATSDHDPFRLTREPSDVPYAPDQENVIAPPPVALPPVSVSGIVGPPWVAVLEGVPGHSGSFVATSGDTLSRPPLAVLVVRRVSRTAVTIANTDTSWALTVREPWQ